VVWTLVLGSDAVCSDGYRGKVLAAVVDPAAGAVTHVVVEPEGRVGLARLVPFGLIDAASGGVQLRCTKADFMDLDAAEQTLAEFVLGYQVPVQLLAPGWRDAGGPAVEGGTIPRVDEHETIDIVPPGEAEERRGARIHATDGDVGELRAFRVDPGTGHVSHVLVREGHVLAHKDVAIPFGDVNGFDDGISLSITKQQVRDLPQADIDPAAT
jgi:sporulation protein YlmC with PRC-barrel domain